MQLAGRTGWGEGGRRRLVSQQQRKRAAREETRSGPAGEDLDRPFSFVPSHTSYTNRLSRFSRRRLLPPSRQDQHAKRETESPLARRQEFKLLFSLRESMVFFFVRVETQVISVVLIRTGRAAREKEL